MQSLATFPIQTGHHRQHWASLPGRSPIRTGSLLYHLARWLDPETAFRTKLALLVALFALAAYAG